MNKFFLGLCVISSYLVSCAGTEVKEESAQLYPKSGSDNLSPKTSITDSSIIKAMMERQRAAATAIKVPANNAAAATVDTRVVQTAIAQPQQTAPGMNPPHGQPKHRCDIAVGAPLNSKPAAPSSAIQAKPTTIAAPVQPVAKGMNPQHGQPGHRCDIAVGAPLNSKPVVAPTAASTVVPQAVKTDSTRK